MLAAAVHNNRVTKVILTPYQAYLLLLLLLVVGLSQSVSWWRERER